MSTCAQCSVRGAAICRSLSARDLDELHGLGCNRVIGRGHTVVWEDDESLIVGNIIEGVFKLCVYTADGREQVVGIMFPSDFIGRPFGSRSSHSVVALTDARICSFPRTAFDDFARNHYELAHELLARTLTQLDRARQWMVLSARKSAGERVAAFLLGMATRLSPDENAPPCGENTSFDLPFGRQDMADILGLTIETVSRQITKLRNAGIVATPTRRAVVVLDKAALEACAKQG